MNIKTSDSDLNTDTQGILLKVISEKDNEQSKGGYGRKEIALKKSYHNISRNGDTVELSEKGQKLHRVRSI